LSPKIGRGSNTFIRQSGLQTYITQKGQRRSLQTSKKARPVVYILYRKHFGDNIYEQWELRGGYGCLAKDRNLGNW
jgi:hypothetical protein